MNREDCRRGMQVMFGRRNGEKTLGEVVKLNGKTAKVKTLETRGRDHDAAGKVWGVPYSLLSIAVNADTDRDRSLHQKHGADAPAVLGGMMTNAAEKVALPDRFKVEHGNEIVILDTHTNKTATVKPCNYHGARLLLNDLFAEQGE